MGNNIASARGLDSSHPQQRDRSQSSPRLTFSRKKGGVGDRDDKIKALKKVEEALASTGSRGSTSTLGSNDITTTVTRNQSDTNLNLKANQHQQQSNNNNNKQTQALPKNASAAGSQTKSLSPTQFKKFFDQNYILPIAENTTSSKLNNNNNSNNSNKKPPQVPKINTTVNRNNNIQEFYPHRGSVMALRPKTNPIYDDYIISKQVLGLGISGKVISCTNKQTKIKYALKTLRESQKARREIDLQWRSCQGCPYIVQIVDVYENVINNQKVFLIVMECMEGGELFAKISERVTPFTEQEVAKIMHQICSAVKHLHAMKIVHRDLKPENLLLSSNDETAKIKLTDFGFAKEVSLGLATPCYTPYYVAPEVLGSERYDISCDIWSLGVIMYILCCGYPPFYSTHGQPISPGMKRRIKAGEYAFPEAEWSRVSKEAKDLISGMLETIPEKRSTIDDIVNSNWISRYYNVPQTPLPSLDILKEDKDNWLEVQQNMGKALDEMRINWDSKVVIKDLGTTKNQLFEKRMKKAKPNQEITVVGTPKKAGNAMVVDDLSREASMVSMRTVTPTNSRPSSPNKMN